MTSHHSLPIPVKCFIVLPGFPLEFRPEQEGAYPFFYDAQCLFSFCSPSRHHPVAFSRETSIRSFPAEQLFHRQPHHGRIINFANPAKPAGSQLALQARHPRCPSKHATTVRKLRFIATSSAWIPTRPTPPISTKLNLSSNQPRGLLFYTPSVSGLA